jgi:pyrroline-5-carboxylate reductase
MGRAIAERIKLEYEVLVFDKDKNKTKDLLGMGPAENIVDLASKADVIILAVKPQDFDGILKELTGHTENKLVVSIAAGISTSYIDERLGRARIIRVMPNIAARIGRGLSCLCKGRFAGQEDVDFSRELFAHVGKTLFIGEDKMDLATAVSGSGPGFFYDFLEREALDYKNIPEEKIEAFNKSLRESAEAIGFNPDEARFLAEATVSGSCDLLSFEGVTPAQLREQVTSRGGTTQAGIEVLHKGGSLADAVKAALRRARELGKK